MTLEQFLGGCLGLALIALARLVDRWLPPTESGAHGAQDGSGVSTPTPEASRPATGHTAAPPPPSSGELDMVPDDEADPSP